MRHGMAAARDRAEPTPPANIAALNTLFGPPHFFARRNWIGALCSRYPLALFRQPTSLPTTLETIMPIRIPLLAIVLISLGGCNTNPGGLSDADFNALSPDRKAELRMEQQMLDEERMMHSEQQMDRYRRNHQALAAAMEGQGFVPLVPRAAQAPVVISYRDPGDPRFDFERFYGRLRDLGFMIYPGHLTAIPTFRVACIGALGPGDMRDVAEAICRVCAEMGVTDFAPRAAA
jgi:hypothetical protein